MRYLKPISIVGILGAGIMILGIFIVSWEKSALIRELEKLETPPHKSFGLILETHPMKKKMIYQVSDERGKIHEVLEYLNEEFYRKIRVGDNIVIYRKTIVFLGKECILSKIEKNNELPYYMQILENLSLFFIFGFFYFILTVFIAMMLRFNKKV